MKSAKQQINNYKPLIIYLHRYSIEYEAIQFPGMRPMFDTLSKKYKILYLSMAGPIPPNFKLRKGIKVKEIPIKVNRTKPIDKWLKTILYYFFLPFTLIKIKKENPSLIICKETLPFVPSIVSKLKIPMLVDISDWWWSILFGRKKQGKKLARIMEKLEVSHWNKNKILAVAHTMAEAKIVQQKGMSEKKIRIANAPLYKGVYYPYDAKGERKKLNLAKNKWVVAIHGIIRPGKGYEQLLVWWKKLVKEHPNWTLLIIGGAGGEAWCRKKIKILNLQKNIIMTGWLPTQDHVNKYLNAADCLLVIRRNTDDNKGIIPSALYHSLATGKPTLITGLPGMAEVVKHKVSGYIFEPDNYKSFKSVLEHIFSHPKEATKVGKTGIKRGNQCFDPKLTAEKYFKYAEEAMQLEY